MKALGKMVENRTEQPNVQLTPLIKYMQFACNLLKYIFLENCYFIVRWDMERPIHFCSSNINRFFGRFHCILKQMTLFGTNE